MDFAFILDPLPLLKAYKDSSVAMMRSLAARGHRIFALTPADLYWHAGATRARVAALSLHADVHDWYTAAPADERSLAEFAAVVMRKDWRRLDPPGLGEHTAEILGEVGVDASRLEDLRKSGVV